MKKGFTLVELLAVIVILAIILLIAIPTITRMVNDASKSALLRSSELYLSAVQNAVMKKNISGKDLKLKQCSIEYDGSLFCNSEYKIEVEVDGDVPIAGNISFTEGEIRGVSLEYSTNEIIIKDEDGKLIYEGEKPVPICTLITGDKTTKGSKYSCEVYPGTSHTFFVLSTNKDGSTNLIMERNICEDGTYATKEKPCIVTYNSTGSASGVGPVSAMAYLNTATSKWVSVTTLNLTYNDEGLNFTNFEVKTKARLPFTSELSQYSAQLNNGYLFNFLNISDGIRGYWTFSTLTGDPTFAWLVGYDGTIHAHHVDVLKNFDVGVRPVITVKL